MIDFYSARARGGVGLIIVEPASVVSVPFGSKRLCIESDEYIPGLKELTDAIKRNGAKSCLQIVPPPLGQRMTIGTEPEKAKIVGNYGYDAFNGLTKEDFEYCKKSLAEATVRSMEAGFDAVEFHAAHGTFLCASLSPFSNRREDEYGGNASNRARLMCEIVALAHQKAGPEYPLIVRLSGSEFMEGGTTVEEAIVHGKLLLEAGVNALHITGGNQHRLHWHAPLYFMDSASLLHLATAVKQAVNVPTIAVGRITDLSIGEQAIAAGKADFIAVGRPLLADPDYVDKVRQGRFEEIRPCIYCNNCHNAVFKNLEGQKQGLPCTVNPGLLLDESVPLKPAGKPKRIMVVGGGLAGMEAARVLAERGHMVTLFEKSAKLGGQWNIACQEVLKEKDFSKLTDYMIRGLQKAGVKLRLNVEVSPGLVKKENPEVVIVATGAIPTSPDVPGVNRSNVVQANDVITGKAHCGGKVVMVGARYVGMETADFLAGQGKKVSLVDLQPIGMGVGATAYAGLMERLVNHGVYFYPNSPLYEIREHGVYIVLNDELLFLEADTVVLAVGVRPQKDIFEKLKGSVTELYAIGDCVEPSNAMKAIKDGAELGRRI